MRRRDRRPRACRAPGTARRRDAAAARGRTRSSRRGSEGARRGRRRGTTPPPRPRRGHPRPRAAGRAARGRAPRGARRGGAAAPAPRRAPSSAAPSRTPGSGRGACSSSTNAARGVASVDVAAWSMQFGGDRAPRGHRTHHPASADRGRNPHAAPRTTTPRGTPGALMSRYRGTCDAWVTASCRDRDARPTATPAWLDVLCVTTFQRDAPQRDEPAASARRDRHGVPS